MKDIAFKDEMEEVASYASCLHSWERIAPDTVCVVTKEQRELTLAVTDAGWFVNGTKDPYPTLESALMAESPQFTASWDNELAKRLESLRKQDGNKT